MSIKSAKMKLGVKVRTNVPFAKQTCDMISVILTSIMSSFILLSFVLLPLIMIPVSQSADLVIRIPHDVSQQDGFYRLDYQPTIGIPPANQTFRPADIRDAIEFSRGAPGTKYSFKLYYSNSSLADWLTWTASITTAPDPPSNLSIGKFLKIKSSKTRIACN